MDRSNQAISDCLFLRENADNLPIDKGGWERIDRTKVGTNS